MAKPKFDYDSGDFYEAIFRLASMGMTDMEIADSLEVKFEQKLSAESFSCMKNGKYKGWNKDQNKRRGERISKVLARARARINAKVRQTYLNMALGTKKITSQTRIYAEKRCSCLGSDSECEACHGTGRVVSTEKAVIQETESEMAPNMQALSTWLYHHDPEWRKAQDKEFDDDQSEVDIEEANWINNAGNTDK